MSDEQEQTPIQPTPASEFRRVREQGEIVTIRSTGRVVCMRVVKPAALLRLGKIPDILSELAISILYGKITSEQYAAFFALAERKEHAVDMAESLRVVCTAASIYPRIVEDVGQELADDEIVIDDLEDGEQRFIFDLAFREATGLSRFRREQETGMDVVAQVEVTELPTKPVA